jgi:hypothetical protein
MQRQPQRQPLRGQLLRGTAAAAALALTLVGCSSGGGSGGAGGGEAALGAAEDGVAFRADGLRAQTAPRRGNQSSTTPAAQLLSRDVIQHATLGVRTKHVGAALARVRVLVAGVQGIVADEHTETGLRGGARRSTLTLRVPAPTFATTLEDIDELGRVTTQEVTTEDVSTQVVDVEARIVSAERTLERIRDLLDEATDFSDVLSLESELARREADLASLKAQQAYLEDQTSLSTIVLTLLPAKAASQEKPDEEPAGFLAGLDTGWDALVSLVTVVLTALGVVVPLLLVLAPAGLLLWWALRRALRRQPFRQPLDQTAP